MPPFARTINKPKSGMFYSLEVIKESIEILEIEVECFWVKYIDFMASCDDLCPAMCDSLVCSCEKKAEDICTTLNMRLEICD